jgi:hypothetical protein
MIEDTELKIVKTTTYCRPTPARSRNAAPPRSMRLSAHFIIGPDKGGRVRVDLANEMNLCFPIFNFLKVALSVCMVRRLVASE